MTGKFLQFAFIALFATPLSAADIRHAYLEDQTGARTKIATIDVADDGSYSVEMNKDVFTDHFLSMRPFKCLEGPRKNWCHVPYPYPITRSIADDLTDLEYDFLFIWKGRTDYGIDMWNGIYYQLVPHGTELRGALHEMDMDLLSAPPAPGNLRPLRPQDIIESEPDSHWLPRLIIE